MSDHSLAYQGDWVRVRGILRPVPRKEIVEPEVAPLVAVPSLPVTPDTIACPTCHATMAQHCRSKTGRRAKYNHLTRFTPRTCGCGAELERQRQLCAPCRAESDRRRSRESKRRARAAA